jgi:hypothetical protein
VSLASQTRIADTGGGMNGSTYKNQEEGVPPQAKPSLSTAPNRSPINPPSSRRQNPISHDGATWLHRIRLYIACYEQVYRFRPGVEVLRDLSCGLVRFDEEGSCFATRVVVEKLVNPLCAAAYIGGSEANNRALVGTVDDRVD